ncbi:MAG: DUF262 domain-containing protein [Puniceicoccaceae bacterium]|nr:MAG: DUF262 domain-containing protein [Puniceicoccaceae bacterium]
MAGLKKNLDSLQETARERTVKTQNIEYDLETLVKRVKSKSIQLNPDYQRRHRWSDEVSSRLIESLLLNIPIPAIFISQDIDVDEETEAEVSRYTVIDGQQRLTAIFEFMTGQLRLTGLEILKEINDCNYKELPPFLLRRLEERTVKCLRIDSTIDPQVKYDIFERLNTGSIKLEAQELRNAVARGKFNDAIKELSKFSVFREMLQISENDANSNAKVKKMEDVELVLRFFALRNGGYKISRKSGFKDFLTETLVDLNKLDETEIVQMKREFKICMLTIYANLGKYAFSKHRVEGGVSIKRMSTFNAAVYDAIAVGFAEVHDLKAMAQDFDFKISNPDNTESNIITEHMTYSLFEDSGFFESVSGSVNDVGKIVYRVNAVVELLT